MPSLPPVGTFNIGMAAVVFLFVFATPAAIVWIDALLESSRAKGSKAANPIGYYVEAWSEQHEVLAAFLLVAFFALLGHFVFHPIVGRVPGT